MLTKAVRLHRVNDLRLETFELPDITDGEILASVVSDSICRSTCKAAAQGEAHKRVPEDICVVGNGDTESFLPLPVSLTSIHSSPIDLAEQAMSLLLENMASETPLPPRHIVLPVTLTKRNSC